MTSYPRTHVAKAAARLGEKLPASTRLRLVDPEHTQACDERRRPNSMECYRMSQRLERDESQLVVNVRREGKRSTSERTGDVEVGCTLTKLDWNGRPTSDRSRANSGAKLDHRDIGDGSIATAREYGRA